ncbi:MAG TPA: hypothetical protein DCE71_02005 [Parachlamydiales bacterium]|nr:hypothetical protein [Parachlamydiales bacterium]
MTSPNTFLFFPEFKAIQTWFTEAQKTIQNIPQQITDTIWEYTPKPIQDGISFAENKVRELSTAIMTSITQNTRPTIGKYCEIIQDGISTTISSIWSGFTKIFAASFVTNGNCHLDIF